MPKATPKFAAHVRRSPVGLRPAHLSLAVSALAIAGAPASAQPMPEPGTGYAVERVSEAYSGCPGSISNISTGDGGGVKGEFNVNLPFMFQHYEQTFDTVTVVGAGVLAFPSGQRVSINNTALGTTAAPNALIAAWWEDIELLTSNSGFLGTSLSGTAPNREFCIEWNNFNDEQVNNALINFKVVLHEGVSGRVDVSYGPTMGGTGSYTATMGMEDSAGMRGVPFKSPDCNPNCQQSDLVSLANTRVTATRDAGLELVALGVDAPEFAFLGASTLLPVRLASVHANPIGPFEIEVRVADNPQMNGAVVVGTRQVSLGAFQSLQTEVEVVPPSSLGEQRVWFQLVVDSTSLIAETSEDNNRAVSANSTRLLPSAPDLAVESVRVGQTQLTTEELVDVYVHVRNRGGVAVSAGEVAVVLSTNPAVSRFDQQLQIFSVDLQPGEALSATVAVSIPAGLNSGAYYIGALADPNQAIDELDEINNGLAFFEQVQVRGEGLAISTTELVAGRILEPYFGILSAAGGTLPLTWAVSQGSLPQGLGLVPGTGELYGRPSMEETQTFTVTVTDAEGDSDSRALTLRVVQAQTPLTIVTRTVQPAVLGQEYAARLVVVGGTTASEDLVWSASQLPVGISLNASGVLVGTPQAEGESLVQVELQGQGESTSAVIRVQVVANPWLRTINQTLSSAILGEPYRVEFQAAGGQEPYTWILESGSLPPGLSLSPTGELLGTPEQVGRFRFVLQVRDAGAGAPASDRATYELEVLDPGGFVISTEALPVGEVGKGYDAVIATTGGRPPYAWAVVEGRVPEGIVVQQDERLVELRFAGQADAATTSNLLIEVVDAQGRTASRAFALRIVEPTTEDPGPVDGGCTCVGPTASGGAWGAALLGAALLGLRAGRGARRRRRRGTRVD